MKKSKTGSKASSKLHTPRFVGWAKDDKSVPIFLFGDEGLGDGQSDFCVCVNFVVVMGTRCFAHPTFA